MISKPKPDNKTEKNSPKRRLGRVWIIAAAVVLFASWMLWGNLSLGVTRCSVEISGLPQAFDGFKIAVISDLHNAEFGRENSRLIGLTEGESPDIIALTGDIADSRRTDIQTAASAAEKLAAIAPCFYVTGNHESRIGEQYQQLEDLLTAAGVTVLHDRFEKIQQDGEELIIAGLDDPAFAGIYTDEKFSAAAAKLTAMDMPEGCCVLLSHRPEMFETYVSSGVDLVLCGHAHGGQFRLPFIGGLIAPDQGFFPKYDAGMFSESGTVMIVSRGIGNSIFPVRFNNRPEIVIVELRCGS